MAGPLINLAYRFCRDRGMAEEMAQEAFLKVYRNLGRWRRESRFSTWMFSVALNHYRTVVRRYVPPSIDPERLAAPIRESQPAGDLAAEMETAARDETVRRAVAALPTKYRDVVILYYFLDNDVSETARATGLKEGTVKARLHRARNLLERKLKGVLQRTPVAAEEA